MGPRGAGTVFCDYPAYGVFMRLRKIPEIAIEVSGLTL
jgi:hypothetical protein